MRVVLLFIIGLLASCSVNKQLMFIDEWEGTYELKEFNSCCDSVEPVRLHLEKSSDLGYNWKLFWKDGKADTIYGKTLYEKKELKFFVTNNETANKYFVNKVDHDKPVFVLRYVNYYTKDTLKYVDCFTKWNNELMGYRSQNKLFAGIHYHFRNDKTSRTVY